MNTAPTRRRKGLIAPAILILVGAVLLLERSGVIDRHALWQLMPLLPIGLGITMLASRLLRRAG